MPDFSIVDMLGFWRIEMMRETQKVEISSRTCRWSEVDDPIYTETTRE